MKLQTTAAPVSVIRPNGPCAIPTWEHELELHARAAPDAGIVVAGVDEAGRGAWAGPLVAAAVVFPHPQCLGRGQREEALAAELARLRDSKLLAPAVRERLVECIESLAVAVGIGVVSAGLLDVIGVGPANRLAMTRAIRNLGLRPDFLLIDAFPLPAMPIPQRAIIKGDASCMSIAAASVIAKVVRYRMMDEHDRLYPGYGFARHKGYGTPLHVDALMRLGPSPVHRRSYEPVRAVMPGQVWDESEDEDEGEDDREGET